MDGQLVPNEWESKMKATVELSPDEIVKIIKNDFECRGYNVTDITLSAVEKYEDRPGGSSYPVFEKAIVGLNLEAKG